MAGADAACGPARAGTILGITRGIGRPTYDRLQRAEPWLRLALPAVLAFFVLTLAASLLASVAAHAQKTTVTLATGDDPIRYAAFYAEDKRVGTPDVWIHNTAKNQATRFTFDSGTDRDPVWSRDGSRLAFIANRHEQFNIYVRALNGVGGEQLVYESTENANIHDWSRDGRFMLFSRNDPQRKSGRDIWVLQLETRDQRRLIEGPLNQDYPRFSPSGRLLSYQAEDSGRDKVFVMPYPTTGDRWEISPDGGMQPIWRADGTELYYLAPDNSIMAVDVREGKTTVEFGKPHRLFRASIAVPPAGQPNWIWDVDSRGEKFLLILAKDDDAPLTLVTNWEADLN